MPADPAGVHNLFVVLLTSDGRHKVKAGFDYRKVGLKNTSFGQTDGFQKLGTPRV